MDCFADETSLAMTVPYVCVIALITLEIISDSKAHWRKSSVLSNFKNKLDCWLDTR